MEEALFEEKGIRVLKDSENMFYIEVGMLENMEAAKQKASEINEKYAKTFKEEYGMEFNVFVEKRENKHSILDETVPLS